MEVWGASHCGKAVTFLVTHTGSRALHAAGELAACINASTLALIDAGIAMQDFVVACDAGYLDSTVLLGASYSYSTTVVFLYSRLSHRLELH